MAEVVASFELIEIAWGTNSLGFNSALQDNNRGKLGQMSLLV